MADYTPKNIEQGMSDKDYYLTHWGYTLGSPEAEQAWREKSGFRGAAAPMIAPDLPAYESPVTGQIIEGRAARREDLKRTGCRPYEDGERQEAIKVRADVERKADAKLHEATARAFYAMPESKRRAMTRG